MPLIKQEPLSDTPEILIEDSNDIDHDNEVEVIEMKVETKHGRQTAKHGKPYRAGEGPVRKIQESPVKACSVRLNQEECDNNSKKKSSKIANKSENNGKKNGKSNVKKVPMKVSTEVEVDLPKKSEESEKPVEGKEIKESVSVPLVGSKTVSNFENNVEPEVNLGVISNESDEDRAKRLAVIQDSFTIKRLEDQIDQVLTTRTEVKSTKDRIQRLRAVLTLLSREDAVVEYEYVEKEEAQKQKKVEPIYEKEKELKTVTVELKTDENKTDGSGECEKQKLSEGTSVAQHVNKLEEIEGEKTEPSKDPIIKYVKDSETTESCKSVIENVNETKTQEKKSVHFAMDDEDIIFDDKNPDLQVAIQKAISTVDETVANSEFGSIDKAYEDFPLSQNKPYTVQTEDISEDESPKKEIEVDPITEKEVKVDPITGRLVMVTVRKIEDGNKPEKSEDIESTENNEVNKSKEEKSEVSDDLLTKELNESKDKKTEDSVDLECKELKETKDEKTADSGDLQSKDLKETKDENLQSKVAEISENKEETLNETDICKNECGGTKQTRVRKG